MSVVVLFGFGIGLGVFLIGRGLMPAPAPITASLRRLERIGESVHSRRASIDAISRVPAIRRRLAELLVGRLGRRVESDLVVMECAPDRFAIEKLSTALALGAVVVVLALVLGAAGAPMPSGFTVILAMCALAGGFVTPDLTLRSHAATRRTAFRHALSSYLDLVNVLLAGGAGIETSLEAAAQAGDGWAFVELRHALLRARAVRQSPWESFAELGERIGVDELAEIAASVKLAGEQGARIKMSLSAKAAAMRARQLASVEAAAQAATERMGIPTVLMFIGFIVLLGYPAMQQIVRTL